jgi:hypothetical protein
MPRQVRQVCVRHHQGTPARVTSRQGVSIDTLTPDVTREPAGLVSIAEVLEGIASRLRYLAPDHRDPHAFHETKSELVAELRRLARRA